MVELFFSLPALGRELWLWSSLACGASERGRQEPQVWGQGRDGGTVPTGTLAVVTTGRGLDHEFRAKGGDAVGRSRRSLHIPDGL